METFSDTDEPSMESRVADNLMVVLQLPESMAVLVCYWDPCR